MCMRLSQQPPQTALSFVAHLVKPHDISIDGSDETQHSPISNTLVPLIQAVLTLPCVLLFIILHRHWRWFRRQRASAPALHSNTSFASWPLSSLVRMSSLLSSQASWQTCRDSFANSPTPPPALLSGCVNTMPAQTTSTSPGSVSSVQTKSVALPKVAGLKGTGSNRRPSKSHTPGESAGSAQPRGQTAETLVLTVTERT